MYVKYCAKCRMGIREELGNARKSLSKVNMETKRERSGIYIRSEGNYMKERRKSRKSVCVCDRGTCFNVEEVLCDVKRRKEITFKV